MFKFLKEKLKAAVSKFSSKVDEEAEDIPPEEIVEESQAESEKTVEEKSKEESESEEVEEKQLAVSEEEPESKVEEEPETEEVEEPEAEPEKKTVPEKAVEEPEEEVVPEEEVLEEPKVEGKPEPEETEEEPKQEVVEELPEKPGVEPEKEVFPEKAVEEPPKVEEKPEVVEKLAEEPEEASEPKVEEAKPEPKKGFFSKLFSKKKDQPEKEDKQDILTKLKETVTKKSLSEEKFEELFWDLEVGLLENNVAVEVIEKIKLDLKKELVNQKVLRRKTSEIIEETLRNSIEDLFVEPIDLIEKIKTKKPYVILFLGVNGSGKTTNLAKLANHLQKQGLSVVIAACDTFRAAAIQQIEAHTDALGIKLIKHDYGADAAAVAFDAIKHAEAKARDVVLIDTAGRSHANSNLMDELKKIVRIANPDYKIFVGDSLTGNDAVIQAKSFNKAVGVDGIILSKVDVDEKGGAAISVSYVARKPILYIGTGQTYDDLQPFDKETVLQNLGMN